MMVAPNEDLEKRDKDALAVETPKGRRVGAFICGSGNKVIFAGWGTYVGDHPHPKLSKQIPGLENPKIVLDSGKVIWGCECWWGSEEKMKEWMEGKEIIELDIDDYRADPDITDRLLKGES